MIILLEDRATPIQIQEMLQEYGSMVKIAVDIRRRILAGGSEMHADCEQVLLEHGSEHGDIWGANWYPGDRKVEFEALINIRPVVGNRSIVIQNQEVRETVRSVIEAILEVRE